MKKNIAVLFGGTSSEYQVSLASAYGVLTHIDCSRYNVIPIGVTREGKWLHYQGKFERIIEDTWNQDDLCNKAFLSPDREIHGITEIINGQIHFQPIDVIFPVFHGIDGEDGTVQGLAQLAGIKVVGCDVISSALSMDKYKAHLIAKEAGVLVPIAVELKGIKDYEERQGEVRKLKLPVYVKPIRGGSSIGISRVSKWNDLRPAVKEAFGYDSEVIVEEEIHGFEVGCAIIGKNQLTIGTVDEIETETEFFDYHEKYTQQRSWIHLPARVSPHKQMEIKEAASKIYNALGCKGLARVDMFLDSEGEIYFNEVNTMPGLTTHSRFPKMIEHAGIDYEDMISMVIEC